MLELTGKLLKKFSIFQITLKLKVIISNLTLNIKELLLFETFSTNYGQCSINVLIFELRIEI